MADAGLGRHRQPDRLILVAVDRRGRVIGRAESRATLAALLPGLRFNVAIQRGRAPSYVPKIHEGRVPPGLHEVVTPSPPEREEAAPGA